MELHVGRRIAHLRQELGLEQEAFARLLGMSQGRVSQLENSPWVQLRTLQRIAEKTGWELTTFFLPPEAAETPELAALRREREQFRQETDSLVLFVRDLLGEWLHVLSPSRSVQLAERLLALAQRYDADWASRLQIDSLLALADLRETLGEYTSARASVERALTLAEAMDSGDLLWACRYKRAVLDYRAGEYQVAADAFQQVAEQAPWGWRWRGYVGLSTLAEQTGRLSEAGEALEQAWALLPSEERRRPSLARLYIESNRVNLALAAGDFLRAEALARSSLHTALQAGDEGAALEERTNLAFALLEQGREEEAEQVLRAGLQQVQGGQDRRRWALAHSLLARVLVRQGKVEEATEAAGIALQVAEALSEPVVEFYAEWAMGEVEKGRERWHRAYHHLQRAHDRAERHRWPLYRTRVAAELALVLMELGEGGEAERHLREAQEVAEASGARSLRAEVLAGWARWYRWGGDEVQARTQAQGAWEVARRLALAPLLERLQSEWPELGGDLEVTGLRPEGETS